VKQSLVVALIAISAIAVISNPAAAHSGLGGTSWTSDRIDCGIGDIDFHPDGTAVVYDGMWDSETAHWTLDGNAWHLRYDHWYGKLEGTITDANRLDAVETWRSNNSEVIHHSPCIYRKK
jgi:hypothetical protein